MGKALYRTHRSRKLSDVVGQDHITKTLQNALKSGKISHAYLFTGPRGVGKTSVARILAHEINNLPYLDDERQHIDIIEIDAASNRRIDEIRDLRDKARLSPLEAPYKVYIIDEVHMLTREAFNALLKTLEEPPGHVVFILATTEAHKLPDTIISRTQRYSFKPINNSDAIQHLKSIAKKEGIEVEDRALELIAQHSNGSFRDSISLLDQISNIDGGITEEVVRLHLGIPPDEVIAVLIAALNSGDSRLLLETLHQAQSKGFQASIISSYLSEQLRNSLLEGSISREIILPLLRGLLGVPGAANPYQELELVLLESSFTIEPPASVPHKVKPSPDLSKPSSKAQDIDLGAQLENGLWDKVLDRLRGAHNTLYGLARMAIVSADGDTLVLGFAFDFHRRRFDESRTQEKLQTILSDLLGSSIQVRCMIDKNGPKEAPKTPKSTDKAPDPPKSDTLGVITKVFGGGEVLED